MEIPNTETDSTSVILDLLRILASLSYQCEVCNFSCKMDLERLLYVVADIVEGVRIADSSHSGSLLGLAVINRLKSGLSACGWTLNTIG